MGGCDSGGRSNGKANAAGEDDANTPQVPQKVWSMYSLSVCNGHFLKIWKSLSLRNVYF